MVLVYENDGRVVCHRFRRRRCVGDLGVRAYEEWRDVWGNRWAGGCEEWRDVWGNRWADGCEDWWDVWGNR
jgi:hypothetical protein